MKNRNVLIISDQKLSNLGDLAIFLALKDKLVKLHNYKIFKVSNKTFSFYGAKCINANNIPLLLKVFYSTDKVYMGGGGIFQDESSFLNMIYYFLMSIASFIFRKPVVIVSVGVTSPKYLISKYLLTFICWNSTSISVRDEGSLKILKKYTSRYIRVEKDLVFDLDFSIQTYPNNTIIPNKEGILVAPRYLLSSKLECDEFLKSLAFQLDLISKRENKSVYLLACDRHKDIEVCLKLKNLMASKVFIFEGLTPYEVYHLCKVSRLVIFMRLHAGIIAYIAGCKIFGINYSSKVKHFLDDIHEKGACIEPINVNQLSNRTISYF